MTDAFVLDLEQSSAWLGGGIFTPDWLKAHKHEYDHVRLGKGRGRGGRIGFTRAQLEAIVEANVVTAEPPTLPASARPVTRRRAVSA